MQLTLNFSAPLHFCSVDLVDALVARFVADNVRLRMQALYPDRREWRAVIDTPLDHDNVIATVDELNRVLACEKPRILIHKED